MNEIRNCNLCFHHVGHHRLTYCYACKLLEEMEDKDLLLIKSEHKYVPLHDSNHKRYKKYYGR